MTEAEAKLILGARISRFDHAGDVNEALEIAKKALDEIQRYREIGTVEECLEAMGKQQLTVSIEKNREYLIFQELEEILREMDEERGKVLFGDRHIRFQVGFFSALDKITEIILKHMNDGWFLADERRPKAGIKVIAKWKFKNTRENKTDMYIDILWIDKTINEWYGSNGALNGDVIKWRYLPESCRQEMTEV